MNWQKRVAGSLPNLGYRYFNGLHGDAVQLAITVLYDTLQEIVETWRNLF
ncbi:hypothetical protein [Xylella fastidiosa]|nr:hypothetical protein [Xylella fastidiosa]MDG5824131.1 hypothetical protein [Xylella fastidiosa subsp. pauca]MDG5824591.1 hypothetical protein [Xylella fastidiosa subsp. pauca]WGZ32863.1 hypothetical protein O4444_04475 [Xylella fastidiosa subsp. pauca]WGZ33334.1 hypothetical protein O4445_06495 [Xylella fastidiosa subsp. pauca]WGZ35659.1 hypothetical protein O4443_06475 [Xylella fastidiosa subsp. pauca]